MKCMNPGIALTLLILVAPATALSAEIYKTVDKDGNVIYTDKAPESDSTPMDMPALSVVETPEYNVKPVQPRESEANADGLVTDLPTLKRGYRDFHLTSPMPEQSFHGTANSATISWDAKFALQEGMSVVMYVDSTALPATTAQAVTTGRLNRGEHTARAELRDADGRTVATAAPVTFYIQQQSVNNARRVRG